MISLGFGYADATDAKQFKQTSLYFVFSFTLLQYS